MPVFEHTYDEPGSQYGKFPAGLNPAFCRLDLRLPDAAARAVYGTNVPGTPRSVASCGLT